MKTKRGAISKDLPKLRSAQIQLLERLCNAISVSGDEGEVREIVLEQVKPYADEVKIDALGNVLVTRKGITRRSDTRCMRVMLAAHMDEVGFMIVNDEGEGIFRFSVVGGIDSRQLPGHAVKVGSDHIPAVIGAKPVHLVEESDLKHVFPLDDLRIDAGPGNGKGGKIKVGDWATFAIRFKRIGPSLRAKALDDRVGVASLIELVKHAPANIDLLAAFTVQEEVGLRGAGVAAYAFDPDIAIVLDCTPANDLPDWHGEENIQYNTHLGAGPAIYTADRATLSDPRLVRFFIETAEVQGIPYQLRQPGGGSTDAGAIHHRRTGIPSISISVPTRYPHTAASIARFSDWQNTFSLVYIALSQLTSDVIAGER